MSVITTKERLDAVINDLFASIIVGQPLESTDIRNKKVQSIIDEYYDNTNRYPSTSQLDRLATYILKADTFGAKWKDSVDSDYPTLSNRQYKERLSREASFMHADSFDNNGVNRKVKTRSNRIEMELRTKKVK